VLTEDAGVNCWFMCLLKFQRPQERSSHRRTTPRTDSPQPLTCRHPHPHHRGLHHGQQRQEHHLPVLGGLVVAGGGVVARELKALVAKVLDLRVGDGWLSGWLGGLCSCERRNRS